MSDLNLLKTWRELSKSGIVALVLISVFAGYLVGQPSELPISLQRLFTTLVGILLLASGSSALNQWQEREIDALMPRTAGRPLPSGKLSPQKVLIFVFLTLTSGLALLAFLSSELLLLGLLAVLLYNGLYTLWWKRHWAYAAVPGAIPGAIPILMGHVAANGKITSPSGLYLFFILFFWQMPHFWALALRYQKDYEQGGFPTLPVAHGLNVTIRQITVWCLSYVGLALIGPLFMPVGWIYLSSTLIASAKVIFELFRYSRQPQGTRWLPFFLWINFSLIIYLFAACADLWSHHSPVHFF